MLSSGNLKTAFATLRQSKWRSALTMMGVVIGITSVVTIVSLGQGLKNQIAGHVNQIGKNVLTIRSGDLVNKNNGGTTNSVNFLAFLNPSTLTNQDVQALNKIPHIQDVVPINFVTSSASAEHHTDNNLYVVGTNYQMPNVLRSDTQYGDFFDQNNYGENIAVIGQEVAHRLFGELNPVGQAISVKGQDFIVHGVLHQTSGGQLSVAEIDFNNSVFIPMPAATQLTNSHTNILQILVKPDNKNLSQTVTAVQNTLLKTHQGQQDFTVLTPNELLNITGSSVDILTRFVGAIAAISLLVGGISIMDIMWVSVSERTREIGVRKAVGATNRQILNQFLVEGSVLCVAGGIVGVLVSLFINLLLRLYTSLQPAITIPVMILAVAVSVAVGIIFSVAPALKAASMHPIDALRRE